MRDRHPPVGTAGGLPPSRPERGGLRAVVLRREGVAELPVPEVHALRGTEGPAEDVRADEADVDVSAREIFMEGAWYSFIAWAWQFPKMRAEFERDTGRKLLPQRGSGIEQMVDRVTGAAADEADAFVEWATRKHWGVEDAPKLYQQALQKKTTRSS